MSICFGVKQLLYNIKVYFSYCIINKSGHYFNIIGKFSELPYYINKFHTKLHGNFGDEHFLAVRSKASYR